MYRSDAMLPAPATSRPSPKAFLQDAVWHLARLHKASMASILLLEGDALQHGASIGLPDDYLAAIDGVVIGRTSARADPRASTRRPRSRPTSSRTRAGTSSATSPGRRA